MRERAGPPGSGGASVAAEEVGGGCRRGRREGRVPAVAGGQGRQKKNLNLALVPS
jgi:ribosomal protein L25 (general stress protein Ctc)